MDVCNNLDMEDSNELFLIKSSSCMAIMAALLSFSVGPLSANCPEDLIASGHEALPPCIEWHQNNHKDSCAVCVHMIAAICAMRGTAMTGDQFNTELAKCPAGTHETGASQKNKKSAK